LYIFKRPLAILVLVESLQHRKEAQGRDIPKTTSAVKKRTLNVTVGREVNQVSASVQAKGEEGGDSLRPLRAISTAAVCFPSRCLSSLSPSF